MTTATLLAAGRGRRLGLDGPKVLLEVAGRSLLGRHLDHLDAVGVERLVVVTGFAHDTLTAALDALRREADEAGRPYRFDVEVRFNERFERGSLVSLACAFDRLEGGGLWMDADVMYPTDLLRRLVEASPPSCVLLDDRSSEQGEEMMLAVKGGRVRRIGRTVGAEWDLVGESVGFFKIGTDHAAAFGAVLEAEIAAGRLDQEHEEGLDRALDDLPFGYELVGDVAWTEIDFPDDVSRAEAIATGSE